VLVPLFEDHLNLFKSVYGNLSKYKFSNDLPEIDTPVPKLRVANKIVGLLLPLSINLSIVVLVFSYLLEANTTSSSGKSSLYRSDKICASVYPPHKTTAFLE